MTTGLGGDVESISELTTKGVDDAGCLVGDVDVGKVSAATAGLDVEITSAANTEGDDNVGCILGDVESLSPGATNSSSAGRGLGILDVGSGTGAEVGCRATYSSPTLLSLFMAINISEQKSRNAATRCPDTVVVVVVDDDNDCACPYPCKMLNDILVSLTSTRLKNTCFNSVGSCVNCRPDHV